MANIKEEAKWEDVYQLETSDPVEGGPGGVANKQAQNLANRTSFLKDVSKHNYDDRYIKIRKADTTWEYSATKNGLFLGQAVTTDNGYTSFLVKVTSIIGIQFFKLKIVQCKSSEVFISLDWNVSSGGKAFTYVLVEHSVDPTRMHPLLIYLCGPSAPTAAPGNTRVEVSQLYGHEYVTMKSEPLKTTYSSRVIGGTFQIGVIDFHLYNQLSGIPADGTPWMDDSARQYLYSTVDLSYCKYYYSPTLYDKFRLQIIGL